MHYLKNPFILAILGGIIVGVAIALNFMINDDDLIEAQVGELSQELQVQPKQPDASNNTPSNEQTTSITPATPEAVQDAIQATQDSVQDTVQEEAQEKENVQQKSITVIRPAFDVVRITVEGHAVIAGQAQPDSSVKILLDDQLLGSVKADKHGEWVFVPSKPLVPGTKSLSLMATSPNGFVMKSDQVVIINVPERGTEEKDDSFAVVLSQNSETPTQILQKPGQPTASLLSIDAIDYDENGEISITGTAKENSMVNIYLDNTYIGTSRTSEDSQWYLHPETRIKPGQYKLRADQVNDQGAVLERITIPFVRDEVKPHIDPDNYYVVQPGNSLWRIARRTYGEGMEFTVIYKANKDQIGNPDLIYPGQIFSLPKPDQTP